MKNFFQVMSLEEQVEKQLHCLMKEDSILLATIARNNELISKATAQIKGFFEIIETCQAKSAEPAVQAHPSSIKSYKEAAKDASHLIDSYATFAKEIGMKDALNMSCFPQAQGAWLKELEYELQEAPEIAPHGYHSVKAVQLRKASSFALDARTAFSLAVQATSAQEKNALVKRGDYLLLQAEERAANGKSERERNLAWATQSAGDAVGAFKNNDLGKGEYYLGRAEIYAEQGIEAGDAFTFEKFQQEKLEAGQQKPLNLQEQNNILQRLENIRAEKEKAKEPTCTVM